MRIRKKLRESRLKTHLQIRAWLQPKLGKTPVGRSHPSGEHLGPEASEKDFCLCYGNIVALAGMLPCHEQ